MVVISVIIFVYSVFYNSLNLNLNLPILAVIGAIDLIISFTKQNYK